MDIHVTRGNLLDQSADTYVLPISEGNRRLAGDVAAVDRALDGTISRLLRDRLFTGKNGETSSIPSNDTLKAKRIVITGIGPRQQANVDLLRSQVGTLSRHLRGMNSGSVAIATPPITIAGDTEQIGRALTEGVLLGLYRFDRHHTRSSDRPSGSVTSVTLVEPSLRKSQQLESGMLHGIALAEATNFARDLANEPANLMTPSIMAEHAMDLASADNLECTIIERAEAERLNMGSYLSVSRGSKQPPKFIVLRYRGARGSRTIGLLGKGITFDTGGISLKPGAGMESMKGDMTGAACVIGAMQAISRLKPNINVMAIAPCTENMPSGSATKPGDVVYAMDGQSIEVINTDAEGRLVLADAITYAKSQGCTTLIDVATLTGAMTISLGDVRVGVFSNNDRLWRDLDHGAVTAGDRFWRLPLDDEYGDQIKSDVADMKNTGGRGAGSITAAKFLERFVGDTPWAHLDIAGVMASSSDKGILVKGSTGIPVRTLVQYVLERAQ